jgi:hypothetical protein
MKLFQTNIHPKLLNSLQNKHILTKGKYTEVFMYLLAETKEDIMNCMLH